MKSQFTLYTEKVFYNLVINLFKSFILYLIWNNILRNEFDLQHISYAFFLGALISLDIIFINMLKNINENVSAIFLQNLQNILIKSMTRKN